jgi:spore photoproduct lyase
MLDIPAKTVLIDPEVQRRPNCAARLERILPHIRCGDVRELRPADHEAVRKIGKRRHGKDEFGDDAVLAFTTFDEGRRNWFFHWRDAADAWASHGGACQSALELNVVDGCAFRCAYCGFGRYILFYLDVERLVGEMDALLARHPTQRLWKYSNMTDLPPFEPQLDAVRPMVERFARQADRYLMLFTKSDDVDFLLPLNHDGHTIISWSLSSEMVSREVDRRTAPADQRIDAMRRCQQAGYRVRARLSPIVPVRDWRGEYGRMLEKLFAACRPDIVTLELLGWMDCDDLEQILPAEMLDEQAFAAAKAARDELRGVRWGPFPEATHQEIYRFCIETVRRLSPRTPVAVCHGTAATWDALGGLMGSSPGDYVCNCGPTSAPGNPLYGEAGRTR